MTNAGDDRTRPVRFGYFLSCEEYGPAELVQQAVAAEEAGFEALCISDHYHPWTDEQGESPFVWSVIGAVAQATSLPVLTAVTCPTMRIHPAVVAQAAATSSVMLDGGFVLGLGSGEALNEHIVGSYWPPADIRLEMLEESVAVMRELFTGEVVHHHGTYFRVDEARLYTLGEPPPIYISSFGPKSMDLVTRIADGFITTQPDAESVEAFRSARGADAPAVAMFKVAWADTEEEGVDHAHRLWPTAGLPGELSQVLPSPRHFEQAASLVTRESTAESVVAGSDTDAHVEAFAPFVDAGFDTVYVANMGPHHQEMLRAYGERVLPALRERYGDARSAG